MAALRLFAIVWLLGFFALGIFTLAETLFGVGSFESRMENFLPRLSISLLWPLAILTPRGRYLLWQRWRNPQ
ncbi:MAG TPA: hypothetical protein VET48_09060 [Steroidobacteraceae bacterium]|nr:hypothetical protein [Steroidobacteraceae bacterium]